MKKIVLILASLIFLPLAACRTYEGAAYIKADLARMKCSGNPGQEIKTACINNTVNEETFKGGASYLVVDSMKSINRYQYSSCMKEKGFDCTWGPEDQ